LDHQTENAFQPAGAAIGGQTAYQGRGAADRGEYREVAGVTEQTILRPKERGRPKFDDLFQGRGFSQIVLSRGHIKS
jgi:hypothetical protein